MEYTVVGDTVNIASRLAATSTQGEIIITEQVAQMEVISNKFNCVKGTSMKLKGKQEPITVFRVESGKDEINERIARDIAIIFSTIELDKN
jgi:adenylate cyclase